MRARAGRNQDELGLDQPLAALGRRDDHAVRAHDAAAAGNHRDMVTIEGRLDAIVLFLLDQVPLGHEALDREIGSKMQVDAGNGPAAERRAHCLLGNSKLSSP